MDLTVLGQYYQVIQALILSLVCFTVIAVLCGFKPQAFENQSDAKLKNQMLSWLNVCSLILCLSYVYVSLRVDWFVVLLLSILFPGYLIDGIDNR